MSSPEQDSTLNPPPVPESNNEAQLNHTLASDSEVIQRATEHTDEGITAAGTAVMPTPVYVAGKLRVEFANKGLEKECEAAAQELSAATNQSISPYDYGTIFGYEAGKESNHGAYLSRKTRPYRYLAESAKWILSVDEQDTYVIEPHSVVELNEFISFLKQTEMPDSSEQTLCVIVGEQAGYSESGNEEEAILPKVRCKHMFAFDADSTTIESKLTAAGVNTTSKAISDLLRLLNVKQNKGSDNLERAKNFLAFRYPDIYATRTRESIHLDTNFNPRTEPEQDFLRRIDTRYTQSAPGHTLVDVIFHYQRSVSGRQFSYYATVDVSQLFPYLHSPLSDYIPHNE